MTEETQRSITIDDKAYVITELPEKIQSLIAGYDVWVADRAEAQKKFAQMDAAVRHLSEAITKEIREMEVETASEEAKEETAQ